MPDKENNPCTVPACVNALNQFYKDQTDFLNKKVDHSNECGELAASRKRLRDFLIGLGAALGAYITASITIALKALGTVTVIGPALSAVGGVLAGLAGTLQAIPFIGQILGGVAAAAAIAFALILGAYAKDLYDEKQARQACVGALKKANTSHGAALAACTGGKNCVPTFSGACNCPP